MFRVIRYDSSRVETLNFENFNFSLPCIIYSPVCCPDRLKTKIKRELFRIANETITTTLRTQIAINFVFIPL